MTRVLLITDTERVLRIFESLEAKGVLQLRTVATLDQADLEISESAPDFTFVQSRISGFSAEIQLRHLSKALPKGAKTILLAGDAVDVAQAKKERKPCIELLLDDEAVEEAISNTLAGVRSVSPKKAQASKSEPDEQSRHEEAEDAVPASPAVFEESDPSDQSETAEPVEPAEPSQPFAEVMRLREAEADSSLQGSLKVEDQVSIGASSEPDEEFGRTVQSYEQESEGPLPDGYSRGIPLADAMASAEHKKRPYWMIAVALAFLLVPLLAYMSGKKKAPVQDQAVTGVLHQAKRSGKATPSATATPPIQTTKQTPNTALTTSLTSVPAMSPIMSLAMVTPQEKPKSDLKPAAKPEEKPAAKPEVKAAAKPEVKPVAKPEVKPAAAPVVKAGIKNLPPVLASAKLDPSYGKTHPGWQRFTDTKAEYTIFKEDNVFRAMQVIALGKENLNSQLFKRLLLEFGGIKRFHLESTVDKGDYLVDRGVATGGVALTIYRKKKDLKVKGLVLYYRDNKIDQK